MLLGRHSWAGGVQSARRHRPSHPATRDYLGYFVGLSVTVSEIASEASVGRSGKDGQTAKCHIDSRSR